jgi:hypothetical protein
MSSGKHVIEITRFFHLLFPPRRGEEREEDRERGTEKRMSEAKVAERYTATSISIITGWKRRK